MENYYYVNKNRKETVQKEIRDKVIAKK